MRRERDEGQSGVSGEGKQKLAWAVCLAQQHVLRDDDENVNVCVDYMFVVSC